METTLEELVYLITAVNRSWHTMRDRDADGAITAALRDKKTGLQLELLRTYGDQVELVRDDDGRRALYGLRLVSPVRLPSGEERRDAMHIPVDVLNRFHSIHHSSRPHGD